MSDQERDRKWEERSDLDRLSTSQTLRPAEKTPDQQALYQIGAMAMLAQSDPYASAEVYRKALIDICNYALKAQEKGGQ